MASIRFQCLILTSRELYHRRNKFVEPASDPSEDTSQ